MLEGPGQVVWAVVFESKVHLLDEFLGDHFLGAAAVLDEGSGVSAVSALVTELTFLFSDLAFQDFNLLILIVSFLLQDIEILAERLLLSLKAVSFDVDGLLHSGGVVTVVGLELGHIVESLLALVTLLRDEVE